VEKEELTLKDYSKNHRLDIDKVVEDYYGYIYMIVKNIKSIGILEEDMEEIISDVFLALWKNYANLVQETKIKPYLAGIAKNVLKNKYRKTKIDYPISDYEEQLVSPYTLEIISEEREQNEMIKDTLKILKPEEYQIFMEDVSHQLKTPLTSISIMLDNMLENSNMDRNIREVFLNEISRQIKNINWLVISLLKLAKLDSNTVEFEKKEILVKDIIQDAKKSLEIPLEIKEQTMEINGDGNVKIVGDYNWEKEAITNIIKNCIEHTENNKKIYINYEENNFYTKVKIQDEGKGIGKDEIKHIFDRFFKGSNSSENSIGIGLAISKSIIEKDNGYIICTSEINKGTTFEIKYMKK